MRMLGIDYDSVHSCIQASFEDGDPRADNWILARDRTLSNELSIALNPTITINNHTYYGDFEGKDVFHALCTSFQPKNQPEQCGLLYDIETAMGHE